MEIGIKDTLRKLRQEKNITQETLANHLGITPQSVGKWERGEGFPDITLLPKIALYFNVSIDHLLNFGQTQIDEKISTYEKESMHYRNIGDNEKNLELWEKAYAEFPNDCRVMNGLMLALNRRAIYPCSEAEAKRKISLALRILEESRNTELRENAIQELCYTYESIGDNENALKYANMGGSMFTTKEDLRSTVLKGEEGLKATQEYLVNLIMLAVLACSRQTAQKEVMTSQERIAVEEFCINLWNTLFSDGNVGFYAYDISYRYSIIATIYAKEKNGEKAIEALERCAEYAVRSSKVGEVKYTAPMVNMLKNDPQENTKNYKGNACNNRLTGLSWRGYDFIRGDERFKSIERLLKQYAEEIS